MPTTNKRYASLDYGAVRIGIAMTPPGVLFARPFGHVINDDTAIQKIVSMMHDQQISLLVVGLPRGMQGQETTQTKVVQEFAQNLKQMLSIPIVLQDESLTSVKAEHELQQRKKDYKKSDIDELSACYILEDYLAEQGQVNHENKHT